MDSLHSARMKKLREAEESASKYGLTQLYMHLSALSPTTRKSHAERHGKLFTAHQVREFWANPANVEACKCSVVAILVDENGKLLVPAIQERALETYKKMAARGYEWSK